MSNNMLPAISSVLKKLLMPRTSLICVRFDCADLQSVHANLNTQKTALKSVVLFV